MERLESFLSQVNADGQGPQSLADLRKAFATLEFIAALSLNNRIPADLERSYLAPSIINYWTVFGPVVKAIRLERGTSIYLQHVEALARIISSGGIYSNKARTLKKHELKKIMLQSKAATFTALERTAAPLPDSEQPG